MSSAAQIAANIANAQSSTGPTSEAGRAKSAKNAVTFGLFSGDFIRPGEEDGYIVLKSTLFSELAPGSHLEDVFVDEIHRATWRLRRCGEVESHLVLRLNDGKSLIFDPMETANQNAERIQKSVDRARSQAHRILNRSMSELRKLQADRKLKGSEPAEEAPTAEPAPVESTKQAETQETQSQPPGTPRNAPCPCGSGQKHKRCCGKDAPPVLNVV